MRLKKAAALTLVTAMTASMAAGCGNSSSTADSKAADTTAAGEGTEEKKRRVAINAKSDDPDLAWEFVKFATGEEGAMALADNGIFPAASTDAINEKLAAIPGFPEDGTDALNITSWVLDRPIDAKMAAVRKVLEEEHDLIMIGEEDIDTGIANMNQRAKEARED